MTKLSDVPPALPVPHPERRDEAGHDWQHLVTLGLIPNRNPPAPPEVATRRDANKALLRRVLR